MKKWVLQGGIGNASIPKVSDEWEMPARKRGEPRPFEAVDNPGGWSSYTYCPKFKKSQSKSSKDTNKYEYHCLPTSRTPVSIHKSTGKRETKGWELFYDTWEKDSTHGSSVLY